MVSSICVRQAIAVFEMGDRELATERRVTSGVRFAPMQTMPVHTSVVAETVIGCAIEVHKALGPGLLESAYERCLAHEFSLRGIQFVRQTPLPVIYKGIHLDCGYRLDFIVEHELLLELKTVERVLPIHQAQVLTYLRLLSLHQGLLINFHVPRLVEGLRSFLV